MPDPWNARSAYTAEEAKAMDAWLEEEHGRTVEDLMAVAGTRVAEQARALLDERDLARAVFLIGPGNNGGDAAVAEALMRDECDTTAWRPLQDEPAPPLDGRTLVVDGLFGVGLARPIDGAAREAVERVAASGATVLAVDVPSGLSADTGEPIGGVALRADRTVTFVGPKRGFYLGRGPELCGEVVVADLGFPIEQAREWAEARRAR